MTIAKRQDRRDVTQRRHFSVTYSRCSNINDEPTQCLQAIQSENVLDALTASCLAGTTLCPLKSRIHVDTRQFVFGLLNDFSKLYYTASNDRLVNRLTLKNPGGGGGEALVVHLKYSHGICQR